MTNGPIIKIMKDKTVRAILFGKSTKVNYPNGRRTDFEFPSREDGDIYRSVMFSSEDGFILYLLKKIEKLEEQVMELKTNKKSKKK